MPFDPEPWRTELNGFVRRLGVGADAEDVVQETFVRAVERPPRTHPRAWLYRIALNVVHDRGREASRAESALPWIARRSDEAAGSDPASQAEARNLAARATEIVEGLPHKQRLALLLRVQHRLAPRRGRSDRHRPAGRRPRLGRRECAGRRDPNRRRAALKAGDNWVSVAADRRE